MNSPIPSDSPDSNPIVRRKGQDWVGDRGEPQNRLILGMMTKFWVPGTVKTRLGESIGMEAAARLHRLFTRHLCRSLRHCARSRQLCIAPDDRLTDVDEMLEENDLHPYWITSPQRKGDLGERMSRWFAENLGDVGSDVGSETGSDNRSSAVLIGADCPTLTQRDISDSAQLLRQHDVVIGPAVDGGYYLIGIRGPWQTRYQTLFRDIPWSGPRVMELTVERIAAAGMSLGQLSVSEDIDTIAELDRLIAFLRQDSSGNGELLHDIEEILGDASKERPDR